jgi:hypothetical protein
VNERKEGVGGIERMEISSRGSIYEVHIRTSSDINKLSEMSLHFKRKQQKAVSLSKNVL